MKLKWLASLLALLTVVSTPLCAETSFLNGELNRTTGAFEWSNGGGDPLQSVWIRNGFQQALALERLNLPKRVQRGLQETLQGQPQGRVDLARVYNGRVVGDVMISGNGLMALQPQALIDDWSADRSTMASWYVWTDPVTRERWEILVPDVCNNLILTRLGQAVPCICEPSRGDACFR